MGVAELGSGGGADSECGRRGRIRNGGRRIYDCGRGGIGPELLGLRIGMMPADARAIFKSHLLTSESLKKFYQESKMTLGFTLADSRPQTVPNSDFSWLAGCSTHFHLSWGTRMTTAGCI